MNVPKAAEKAVENPSNLRNNLQDLLEYHIEKQEGRK